MRYAVIGASAEQVRDFGGSDLKESRATGMVFANLSEVQAAQLRAQGYVVNPVARVKADVMPPAPVIGVPTYSPEELVWAIGFEELRGLTEPPLYGEGFNLVVTPIGVVVYYYGFDQQGNRLWFISEVIGVTLQVGQPVEADLFKANGGTFAAPVPPDQSLEQWGTITINVVNCNSITITTDTQEGFKTSNTIRIVSVAGLSCVE